MLRPVIYKLQLEAKEDSSLKFRLYEVSVFQSFVKILNDCHVVTWLRIRIMVSFEIQFKVTITFDQGLINCILL